METVRILHKQQFIQLKAIFINTKNTVAFHLASKGQGHSFIIGDTNTNERSLNCAWNVCLQSGTASTAFTIVVNIFNIMVY